MAYALGFDLNTVQVISLENPGDVNTCLRIICNKWIQKYPDMSLIDVNKALNSHTSNGVPQTRKNRCHWFYILIILNVFLIYMYSVYAVDSVPLDREFRFQPIVTAVESGYNTTTYYNIPVNKTITDSLKTFEERFLYLQSLIQAPLYRYAATDEEQLELLGIYLCDWFSVTYQIDSDQKEKLEEIHNFFLGTEQFFNFMDISLLGMLDKIFLNGTFSSSLASYEESLDQFMTSTPIINLTNLVWTVHTEQNNVDIVLKLGPYWNNKNLKNLQKLIEYVFGADASLMRLISIHHSVLTVTYRILNSSHIYQSVEGNIRHNLLLLKWSLVLKVSIGEVVLFHVDHILYNDTSEALLDILRTANDQDEQFNNNAIRFLVAIGADVNYNGSSYTPLMVAILTGNKPVVTTLLNLNANPNIVDPASGMSMLLMSIINNNIELVEILLQHKANPNIVLNTIILTSLDTSKYSLIVHMLLEYGADPNYQSTEGSPLHTAAIVGCNHCVEILLKLNVDPNVNNSRGLTPLGIAVSINHSSTVHPLLQYNIDHNVTIDYTIYLISAAYKCYDEIFKIILFASGLNVNVTFNGDTLLILASEWNCLPIIRLLFQHNADPMVYDVQGYTSLHICILLGYIECVKIHLEFGVDPNIRTKDGYGYTPLSNAAINENLEIMELLLKKNAKVNSHSRVGLILSSFFSEQKIYQRGYFSLVNMLYCTGVSPLLHSIHLNRIDLVKLLLEHGADPNSCLVTSSALGVAVYHQQFKIIDILLEHNASGNGLYDVFPSIFLAIQFDHVNIVKTLLNHGADVNIQVKGLGATPLMSATLNGNIRMVELLLMKGADPTITTNSGLVTAIGIVNYKLMNIFGYSPLNIEIARRYLMIKKLLSFYIQKQQQQTDDESEQQTDDNSEQLLSSSETKHTHSNSSIYELVYEAEYVLKNESSAAIGKKIDSLRSAIVLTNYSQIFVL